MIAEKADGGMRDALSIFDQVASFSQGNVTFEKTIEDLNVLDADNYFKTVFLALDNKVADIMLLLNGVLAKGFDRGATLSSDWPATSATCSWPGSADLAAPGGQRPPARAVSGAGAEVSGPLPLPSAAHCQPLRRAVSPVVQQAAARGTDAHRDRTDHPARGRCGGCGA